LLTASVFEDKTMRMDEGKIYLTGHGAALNFFRAMLLGTLFQAVLSPSPPSKYSLNFGKVFVSLYVNTEGKACPEIEKEERSDENAET